MRYLPEWTDTSRGTTYRDVAELDVEYEVGDPDPVALVRRVVHLVPGGGRWRSICYPRVTAANRPSHPEPRVGQSRSCTPRPHTRNRVPWSGRAWRSPGSSALPRSAASGSPAPVFAFARRTSLIDLIEECRLRSFRLIPPALWSAVVRAVGAVDSDLRDRLGIDRDPDHVADVLFDAQEILLMRSLESRRPKLAPIIPLFGDRGRTAVAG